MQNFDLVTPNEHLHYNEVGEKPRLQLRIRSFVIVDDA